MWRHESPTFTAAEWTEMEDLKDASDTKLHIITLLLETRVIVPIRFYISFMHVNVFGAWTFFLLRACFNVALITLIGISYSFRPASFCRPKFLSSFGLMKEFFSSFRVVYYWEEAAWPGQHRSYNPTWMSCTQKPHISSWESVSSLRFSVSGHSRRVVIFSGSRRRVWWCLQWWFSWSAEYISTVRVGCWLPGQNKTG